jgi:hypothetical protein
VSLSIRDDTFRYFSLTLIERRVVRFLLSFYFQKGRKELPKIKHFSSSPFFSLASNRNDNSGAAPAPSVTLASSPVKNRVLNGE